MTPVEDAVARIRAWGEARDWRGYDPYDALNTPAAPFLTLGKPLGRRLLTQAVKLSPVNLRPLLGIRPAWNQKAIGIVASAYCRLHGATGEEQAREHAERWLDWLTSTHVGGDRGMAWSYHFDVQTRFFTYPRGTPNTIATCFAGHALLDACELLPPGGWDDAARETCRYLADELYDRDGRFFRYLPFSDELIHNANLLACGVLARTAAVMGADELRPLAAEALETTLRAQRPDGAWGYAELPGQGWVDNFHTAYVLEALADCVDLVPDAGERLDRGLAYWDERLFLPDGTPKYFDDRTPPLEAKNYAQAIDTWLAVADRHPAAVERAERLAAQLVERMLDPAGFVHFQQRGRLTSRVPFIRWTTAPTFKALARVLLQRARAAAPAPAHRVTV